MASSLSPSEQVAQAMLLFHAKAPAAALTVAGALADAMANVLDNDPDPSDDEVNGALLAAVQAQGYVTDLESVSSQYEYLKGSHAGFWAGNYTLVDSKDAVHSLLVNSTDIRLLLDGSDEAFKVPSEDGGFSGQKLVVDNDKVAVEFVFSTTTGDADLTAANADLDDLTRRHAAVLAGSLTVKSDASGARTVKGKRGVATPAGVFHEYGEEPAWIWAGDYQVRYTDTAKWEPFDGALTIAYDPVAKSLSVQLGKFQGADVFYRNSVICFAVELTPGTATQVTMGMVATSGGSRKCYLWFETTGQIRTLTGYALDRLDKDALWKDPGVVSLQSDAVAMKRAVAAPSALAVAVADGFCRTPYDVAFPLADLAGKADSASAKVVADLFESDSIRISGSNTAITGYRMDELDALGNPTGRVVMFTCDEANAGAYGFPSGVKLRAYQQLDEAGLPKVGADNLMVGVLAAKAFALPAMVETDFYELRLSLTGFSDIGTAGLSIGLAVDDARQPGVIALVQPTAADATCPFDANTGAGQDASASPQIADYSKASVLVRGAKAGALKKGGSAYCFSVAPKGAAGFFKATRTTYKTSGTPDEFVQDGAAAVVGVPALMSVPIQMGSCNPFDLVNATWPTAVPGKSYSASVRAQGGVQPFVWRILGASGALPAGLGYSSYFDDTGASVVPKVGADFGAKGLVSTGVSGDLSADATPGGTFSLTVRAMADKSVVARPALASPMITIGTPDAESKTPAEVSHWKETVIAAAGALAIIIGYLIYRKTRSNDEKKEASDAAGKVEEKAEEQLKPAGETTASLTERSRTSANDPLRAERLLESVKQRVESVGTLLTRLDELVKARDAITNPFEPEWERLNDEVNKVADEVEQMERDGNDDHVEIDKDAEQRKSEKK